MKNMNRLLKYAQDGLEKEEKFASMDFQPLKAGAEKFVSGIPGVNRFIQDLRGEPKTGNRIDVQIDWVHGRMAISY